MERTGRIPWVLAAIFGIMTAGALLIARGAEGEMPAGAFTVHRSNLQGVEVSFEYPSGWEVEESSGSQERYMQVQIYGPRAVEERLRTYLVVRAMPPQAEGGAYAGLGDLVTHYRDTLMSSFQVEREQAVEILGTSGRQMDVTGTLRLPWRSSKSQDVPVKSQRVFFEKAGRLFEVGWMGTPEASGQLADIFNRLLGTLTLGSDPAPPAHS